MLTTWFSDQVPVLGRVTLCPTSVPNLMAVCLNPTTNGINSVRSLSSAWLKWYSKVKVSTLKLNKTRWNTLGNNKFKPMLTHNSLKMLRTLDSLTLKTKLNQSKKKREALQCSRLLLRRPRLKYNKLRIKLMLWLISKVHNKQRKSSNGQPRSLRQTIRINRIISGKGAESKICLMKLNLNGRLFKSLPSRGLTSFPIWHLVSRARKLQLDRFTRWISNGIGSECRNPKKSLHSRVLCQMKSLRGIPLFSDLLKKVKHKSLPQMLRLRLWWLLRKRVTLGTWS